MRFLTICMLTGLLGCVAAMAQESLPATHLARLNVVDPNPGAGALGGVAIIAINPAEGVARIRVTAAPPGDTPDTLYILYRPSFGSEVVLASIPFPATSPTLMTPVPLFTPAMLAAVDSGAIWIAVHKRSDHAVYADGPIQGIPSAMAPEPSGLEVVPPVSQTDGTGYCSLVYEPATNRFRSVAWWLDLSGPVTAVRLRHAPPGSNGPVVFDLPFDPDGDQSIGIWENPSAELRSAILNGELYYEVATEAFPHGELRGQIYAVEGFTAAIEPGNEVPPVGGTTASGSAYLLITAHGTNDVFNKLQGVIGNLSGPMTDVHIHSGMIGQSGAPLVTLERPSARTIDLELASGSAGGALSDEIVGEIRQTRTYVNVHTAAHPDGEARGQLIPADTRLTAPTGSVGRPDAARVAFSAFYDRRSQTIAFTADIAPGEYSVTLYGADGGLVRTVACEWGGCVVTAAGLPAGAYFARLQQVGGGVVGSCPVMVIP